MPFENNCFNAAVSNLVFHEVNYTKDKSDVVKKALKVVKKDRMFAFQDLFHKNRIYKNVDDLLKTIKSRSVESFEFSATKDSEFIPRALKLPFIVQ